MSVKASVGTGRRNDADDVRFVQTALGRHAPWLGGRPAPAVTGTWDGVSDQALRAFQ